MLINVLYRIPLSHHMDRSRPSSLRFVLMASSLSDSKISGYVSRCTFSGAKRSEYCGVLEFAGG
jgi:hypothetical protein